MIQIHNQGKMNVNEEKKEDLPTRREKVIAEFSHGSNKKRKKQPITREKHEKTVESQRDESEMERKTPIMERTLRKEEEALGKTDDGKDFVDRLVALSDDPEVKLMHMKTLFPIDLFPDSITIDPVKITIVHKYFFMSQKVKTILIKDIIDSFIEEAPFMATLKIITSDDKDHPVRIAPLKRKEAEKAMKIIQGLAIGRSESPDISKVEAIR